MKNLTNFNDYRIKQHDDDFFYRDTFSRSKPIDESTLNDPKFADEYKAIRALMNQVMLGEDQNVEITHTDFDINGEIGKALEAGKESADDDKHEVGAEAVFPIDYKIKYDGKEYEATLEFKTLFKIGYEVSHGDEIVNPTQVFTDETPEHTEFSSVSIEGIELEQDSGMKEIAAKFDKTKVKISDLGSYTAFFKKK